MNDFTSKLVASFFFLLFLFKRKRMSRLKLIRSHRDQFLNSMQNQIITFDIAMCFAKTAKLSIVAFSI